MKRLFFLLIPLVSIVCLNSCQKINGHVIAPGGSTSGGSGTTGGTGSTSGTGSTGGTGGGTVTTDTSHAYQPLTANSFWKYRSVTTSPLITGSTIDTTINTLTGANTTFNNNVYFNINCISVLYGTSIGYYGVFNHTYCLRATSLIAGLTVNMTYLFDNLTVGGNWTATITDNGMVNGVPAQIKGSIVAVNISRAVNGQTFNNVIHTNIHLQYNYGSGFTDAGIYDYYIAKNVGVVETEAAVDAGGGITVNSVSSLIGYAIK